MARTVADVKAAMRCWRGGTLATPSVLMRAAASLPYRSGWRWSRRSRAALPKAFIEAVERAGAVLAEAGWEVVSAVPPELPRVHEVWAYLLLGDVLPNFPMLEAVMSPPAVAMLGKLAERFPAEAMGSDIGSATD